MDRWPLLFQFTGVVEAAGLPPAAPSHWGALRHVAAAAAHTLLSSGQMVGVLPQKLDLAGEIVLRQNPGVFEVLVRSLIQKRPAFVVRGNLSKVSGFFGLDPASALSMRITATGLLLAFGKVNGAPAAVHASMTESGKGLIQKLCAGATVGGHALPEFAPGILERGDMRIAMTLMDGKSAMPPAGASEEALQHAIIAALRPLEMIHAKGNSMTPDKEFVTMLARFSRLHPRRDDLTLGLAFLDGWDRSQVRSVTVHGDYWLNNLLVSDNKICAVIDWDRARSHGCAALDALHLGFMSYAMWADVYVSDMLASLWTGQWPYPWLAKYSQFICEMFGVTSADLQHIAAVLWLSYFYYADDDADRTEWYRKMAEPICKAITMASANKVSEKTVFQE